MKKFKALIVLAFAMIVGAGAGACELLARVEAPIDENQAQVMPMPYRKNMQAEQNINKLRGIDRQMGANELQNVERNYKIINPLNEQRAANPQQRVHNTHGRKINETVRNHQVGTNLNQPRTDVSTPYQNSGNLVSNQQRLSNQAQQQTGTYTNQTQNQNLSTVQQPAPTHTPTQTIAG